MEQDLQIDERHPLIDAIDTEVTTEANALLVAARNAATQILAEARRRNRRRFSAAAQALRTERKTALIKARAKAARIRHQAFLAENARLAEAGLGRIEQALSALWEDSDCRAAWCRNAIRMTCERLGDIEAFAVEHPETLDPATQEVILQAMSEACCRAPRLVPDPTLVAGLRLRSEHACVDASIPGLMQDRSRIAGEYLAVLGRGEEPGHG